MTYRGRHAPGNGSNGGVVFSGLVFREGGNAEKRSGTILKEIR